MGLFDLPRYWVYVEFANGKRMNVANTDTLSEEEAEKFKNYWEKKADIIKVTLESSDGKVLKEFNY